MSSGITDAPAPFDHAEADIILRSSDNVDFRVFKLFLSLASPVFKTLFAIPQPPPGEDQDIKDGLAVIPVTEDSNRLDTLLRFCYPPTLADCPVMEDLELQVILDIFDTAKKYSLDAIEEKAREAIADPITIEEEPLGCYAIACQERWREVAILAARYALAGPLVAEEYQEIERISSRDLFSLQTYHRKCGNAVYALRLDLAWMSSTELCRWISGPIGSGIFCRCPIARAPRYALFNQQPFQWWEDFMKDIFVELRDRPSGTTIKAIAVAAELEVKAGKCQDCSFRVTNAMCEAVGLFEMKIEETVSQIELELNF